MTNLEVLTVSWPASPELRAIEVMLLGMERLLCPMSLIVSRAFTVTLPPRPILKVDAVMPAPLRIVNSRVDTATSPAFPEL